MSLTLSAPPAWAADETAAAPDLSAERAVLELDLVRLYSLIEQDRDPATKTTLLGHHRELVGRANRLLAQFDSAKYDELRYDINIQCQRLARKQAPLLTPPPATEPPSVAEIALEELNPSPTDRAEVAAALDLMDQAIKRLEAGLGRMTAGSAGFLAERDRIRRLKDRRSSLGREFTRSGWDAFVGELRPTGPRS